MSLNVTTLVQPGKVRRGVYTRPSILSKGPFGTGFSFVSTAQQLMGIWNDDLYSSCI